MKNTEFTAYHTIIGLTLQKYFTEYIKLRKNADDIEGKESLFKEHGFVFKQYRIVIISLCCIHIESLINFYLAKKTDENQFSILESAKLIDKWVTLPSLFIPDYKITTDSQLFEDLKLLIKRRNALTHPKPMLIIDGEQIHKGNVPKPSKDEHKFTSNCVSLPKRLIINLLKYDINEGTDLAVTSGYPKDDFKVAFKKYSL